MNKIRYEKIAKWFSIYGVSMVNTVNSVKISAVWQ